MKLNLKYLTGIIPFFFVLLFPALGFSGIQSDPSLHNNNGYMIMTTWAQFDQVPGKKLFAKEEKGFSPMKHNVINMYPANNPNSGPSGLAIAGLAACFFILFIVGFILGPMGITLFRVPLTLSVKAPGKA